MNTFYLYKKKLTSLAILSIGLMAMNGNAQCTTLSTLNEDFSSFPVGTAFFPMNCWGFVKDPTTISGNAYIMDDGTTSSNNVAVIMGNVNQPGGRYLITPALSTINGTYSLKFDARLLSTLGAGSTLEIGTLDSQTSVSNFTSVSAPISLSTTYQSFTFTNVPATTGHQYIAIKLNPGGNISTALIDNLVWEPTNTTSPCTAVSNFSEDFDSSTLTCCNMGVVPQCWSSLSTATGANQIISNTTPASGTNNIYQFGYGTNKISIVIMPEINNINAGTHQFRFKLRANSGPGDLDFGYITDITDASTFVIIQTISVSNTSYSDPVAERTLTVPTTVPSNARLAIRNPGTSFAGFYWDDAIWEAIPIQGVSVTTQNNSAATITNTNGTLQLEAKITPTSISQNVTWSIESGNNFVSIDNNGLVSAIANGTAVIRATSVADTTKYGEITVVVNVPNNNTCSAVATIDEDFETFTTIPENCWTTNKKSPQIDIDVDASSGNHSVNFYSFFSANDPIYLVSPELSTIDGNHLLEFEVTNVAANATTTTLEVGTMTDNTDFSTFVPVGASITSTVGTHSSAKIPSNTGHKYVAIRYTPNAQHQAIFIDNIKWTTTAAAPKFDLNKVNVYPNPTSGIFYIESELNIQKIEVYNSIGQKILTTSKKEIDMQSVASGMYFVTITAEGKQGTYKLIKK